MNTCPNDRQVFHIIFARHFVGGPIYEKIQVADASLAEIDVEVDDDDTVCEICRLSTNEDRLLLCDQCDNGLVSIKYSFLAKLLSCHNNGKSL